MQCTRFLRHRLPILTLLTALAGLSSARAGSTHYTFTRVFFKDRVIWGAKCELPEGAGLAFGGEDQGAADGRPHTRVKVAGKWKAIHAELRAANPLQKFHDRAWELRNLQKLATARARFIYFKGLTAGEEAERRKTLLDPLVAKLVKARAKLDSDLSAAAKALKGYEAGQARLALGYAGSAAKQPGPGAGGLTAATILGMGRAQVLLEKAAEVLDAEPPARALSPIVYDAKTKLYVIFAGDHLDYLTNDTWTFDPARKKWTQRHPAGAPAPRAGHKLAAAGDGKVKLTGGYVYKTVLGYMVSQYSRIDDGAWTYDLEKNTWSGTGKPAPPDSRRYRKGRFHSDFYLQGPKPNAAAHEAKLKSLPVNTWVDMKPPHIPLLNRDWGSAAFDPGGDMILRWSGGHCAHGGTDVPHYHLSTGRWELPFPVEFPLGQLYANTQYPHGVNFNLRPWMTGHTYRSFGFDPVLKRMVMTGRPALYGKIAHLDYNYYTYDPLAGDWTGKGRKPAGMCRINCFYTLTHCATPRGTVVWTGGGKLFRLEAKTGKWTELKTTGAKLPGTVVDSAVSCYDSKRDRLLCFKKRGYVGTYSGKAYAVDLKTLVVTDLAPAGKEKVSDGYKKGARFILREAAYDRDNDLVFFGNRMFADPSRNLAYDAEKNRWISLQLGKTRGKAPYGPGGDVSLGLRYDPKRKLFWAITQWNKVFALRLDLKSAPPAPLGAAGTGTPERK